MATGPVLRVLELLASILPTPGLSAALNAASTVVSVLQEKSPNPVVRLQRAQITSKRLEAQALMVNGPSAAYRIAAQYAYLASGYVSRGGPGTDSSIFLLQQQHGPPGSHKRTGICGPDSMCLRGSRLSGNIGGHSEANFPVAGAR